MKHFLIVLYATCFCISLITSSIGEAKDHAKKNAAQIIEGVNEDACKYYLSVVSMFQDEAPYLKEWIEYHHLMGIEHFYLYNNNSHDNYLEVLNPYIQKGLVELTEWPSPDDHDFGNRIDATYNHCIAKCKGVSRWLIGIDIDEFVVPIDRPNLIVFLKEFDDRNEVGGIVMNWQCFGTSWREKIPEGKLMTECLTLKAVWNHPWNTNVKSIHKPHKVALCTCHAAHYKPGYYSVKPDGSRGSDIQVNRLRVNHYWTRANDFFFNIKIPRRERYERTKFSKQVIDSFLTSFNVEEDRTIFPFIPELKRRVFEK